MHPVPLTQCIQQFFYIISAHKNNDEMGCFAMGAIRASKKGLPYVRKRKDQLERREFMLCSKGCVAAVKWQDNNRLTVPSTYHSPKEVSCMKQKNRDGTSLFPPCPATVAEYNIIMRAVDSLDQSQDICVREVLIEMVGPSALLSDGPCDCKQFYHVELQQQWLA